MFQKRKRCIIPSCISHLKPQKNVSLHRFPKDIFCKEKWIEAIKTPNWIPDLKPYSRICSNHFESKRILGRQVFIDQTAIPKYSCDSIIEEESSKLEHPFKIVGKDIDASEIGKHPNIIKAAQREMTQSDVLVCGKCHSVFHFIDVFIEHKENDENCSKGSNLRDCRETKPKVWAFLLWKSVQLNNNAKNQNDLSHMNSWQLYQSWVKMEESVRETWVIAGKTIQSFIRVGQGTLQEMPVKIVIDTAPINNTLTSADNRLTPLGNRMVNKEDAVIKREDATTNKEFSPNNRQRNIRNQLTGSKLASKTDPVIIKLNQTSRRAKRTIPNSQTTDLVTVEKIVAKRFNPRRKMHEYLVKWEGCPYEQNSWEPKSHLDTCSQLLETFEKQLARQKKQRAALERARLQQQ